MAAGSDAVGADWGADGRTDTFALGVDFGTSNTVAVMRWPDGRIRPLFFDGSPALPSGVFADPSGELLTGRDAAHAARSRPECFEPNPKRHIDDGLVLLGAIEVPVIELVAAVLRRVTAEATRTASAPLAEITLTHPASWGRYRRQVLVDATAKAGLGEPRLVPEPVAAASYFTFAMGASLPAGSCVVVYDFGAGTFDASVVRRTADGYDVLASEGLPDAGGLDVDAAIFAHLGAVYSVRDPVSWRRLEQPDSVPARRARRLLWEDVRTAKEMLSRTSATLIPIPLLDEDAPVGREQFELLARPILDRTIAATRAALRAANVTDREVTGLFLVGGSSRIPLAASLLHRALRITPTVIEQPELVVAEGSLYATTAPVRPAEPVAAEVTPPPETFGAAIGRAAVAAPVPAANESAESGEPARPPADAATGARTDAARRGLPVSRILAIGGLVVVGIALRTWDRGPLAALTGFNAALAGTVTPLLVATLLFALAGAGIPATKGGPGPVRWALVHAGWAAAGIAVAVLGLIASWSPGSEHHWSDFATWYQSVSWLVVAAAAVLFGAGVWALVRRRSGTARAAPGRRTRVGGYGVAVLYGVLCGLWWLTTAPLAGNIYDSYSCDRYSSEFGTCDAAAEFGDVLNATLPVRALLLAAGAFLVFGSVALLATLLRRRFADRLTAARATTLGRVGMVMVLLFAAMLGMTAVVGRHVASTAQPSGNPVVGVVKFLDSPARSLGAGTPVAVLLVFAALAASFIAAWVVGRRSSATGSANPETP